MTISGNRALTRSEMLVNANYIVNKLTSQGWSKQAVAGMLGNMETESTINPGRWQSGIVHPAQGFGLVQWTPSTKVTSWLSSKGYANDSMDGQLARINYEVDNGVQWITTSKYPMSFKEFKTSTESPEHLAQVFLVNYERPANQNQPGRSTQARYWYDKTDGSTGGGDGAGRQLAEMPISYIYITQGEWGEFSTIGTHNAGTGQELAIDFIFPMNRYPLFAPFDIEVIRRDDNYATVVWKNTRPVRGVDGNDYDELHIIVIHDDNWRDYNPGDTRSKGEHFGNSGNATGTGGISTGDHFHFEVMRGHVYEFPPQRSNQLSIYDIFDTTGVEIAQGRGYDWKTSDFQDGDGGGDGGDGDSPSSAKSDIISMLMTGTLKGWYS